MRKSDGTPLGTQKWSQIKIGGLGFVTSYDVASDGSYEVCKTDVGLGYRRDDGASLWSLLINQTNGPPGTVAVLSNPFSEMGIEELCIAPSDPTKVMMFFSGHAYLSTDKGKNWTDTSLNGTTGLQMGANTKPRGNWQHKSRFDPSNAAVCYYGSILNGLWRYMSGAWTQIASVPASPEASNGDKTIIIAIDPTSSLTGSGATSRRSVVYAYVHGSGLYKSTDGGTTFAVLTTYPGSAGGNKRLYHMICDSTGKLWICYDASYATNNLYYSTNGGTSYTNPSLGLCFCGIEQDPKDATRFVANITQNFVATSADSGATWVNFSGSAAVVQATNCPVTAASLNQTFLPAAVVPHPVHQSVAVSTGYGMCKINTPWPTSTSFHGLVIYEDTAGIEELVGTGSMISPNGVVLVHHNDKGFVKKAAGGYATMQYPQVGLVEGEVNSDWAIDNHAFIACRIVNGGTTDYSAYSSDNGETWTPYPSLLSSGPFALSNSNQLFCLCYYSNWWPRYLDTGTNTWQKATFTGFTTLSDGTANGWKAVCADKSTAGKFYAINNGSSSSTQAGTWRSTDAGQTWAKMGGLPAEIASRSLDTNWNIQIICSPSGDLFLTLGAINNRWTEDVFYPMWKSTDGGATWAMLSNVTEAQFIACGAPLPGSSTPYTLYFHGWYNHVRGLFASYDGGTTFSACYFGPNVDLINGISANPSVFQHLCVSYLGTGHYELTYDYKLLVKGS